MKNKITIAEIQKLKNSSAAFSTITVYDYPSALIINELNIPMVLVGDSASMVIYGYDNTIPISIDEIILITKAVKRGINKSLIVVDMPFMSYQVSHEKAIENAGQLIKIGGGDAVKLEGGAEYAKCITKIIDSGIPVMGHIGLKPQSILTSSGYKIHGKKEKEALQIYQDAIALERAGVFALVLEGVPQELAQIITQKLAIPTIGIGAGKECDGQIQVFHDVVGLFNGQIPKHAKKYMNNYDMIKNAIYQYCEEVQNMRFPSNNHSVKMNTQELENLKKKIETI